MKTVVRKMLDLMSPRERRRLWLLTPVVAVNALLQVVGIAAIMPFLALIASPESIQEHELLLWAYGALGFTSEVAFLVFVGVMVLVALVLSNGFAALTHLLMLRFSWSLHHSLALRMLRVYLAKPYVFFLDQNTAGLVKNTLGEVHRVVSAFLMYALELVARSVVAVSVVGLLLVVEPVLALVAFGLLGAAYGGLYLWVNEVLGEAGWRVTESDGDRYKAASEALSGVKEIKLLAMEEAFVERFAEPDRRYVRSTVVSQVISSMPRYAFETIAFGAMILIVLYLLVQGQGVTTLLPTLGVFAFASYRLLPMLQQIFSAVTGIRYSTASVEVLHRDLAGVAMDEGAVQKDPTPLPFRHALELREVTFAYPNVARPLLEAFDLKIQANTMVAFVGTTGAGKTTVVDLLLGLLRPQEGHLVVDGGIVDDPSLPAWQKNLGYVPQTIYLADDTIAANIAFGVPSGEIDMAAVELAARRAQIHDFIVEELPGGYDTEVGEHGVRLSGGQRQRLGMARALFHDPAVLVLDEATSALDNVTEEGIFQAIREIGHDKTIVMIAHRISTVQDCDVIYVLDHGRLIAQGDYRTLMETSPQFRELARARDREVQVGA